MRYHHEAEKSDPAHRLLISSVAITGVYANIFVLGFVGNHFIAEDHIKTIFEQSKISWGSLSQLHESIQDSIDKASIFLQVS